MHFFAELNRRNVVRVGLAYLVISWLLLQVVDTLGPVFDIPAVAPKWLFFALLIGFIPAMLFSWAYEITSEGIKLERDINQDESITSLTGRKLDIITIISALAVLGLFMWQQLGSEFPISDSEITVGREAQEGNTQSGRNSVEGTSRNRQQNPAQSTANLNIDAPADSIAVLAFANLSPDPENAFFAEGISEEILNVLAGIDGLKVASRTSAFSFRGKDVSIRSIASQLGVQNVLEGSVRKQGNKVRITAQLIDANTDAHLWSQSYNRDLTDIFAVQEEIANSITNALSDTLGMRTVSVEQSTQNFDAYEKFLHGRMLFYQRYQALNGARAALEEALAIDPEFAEAAAYLAATYVISPGYSDVIESSDTAGDFHRLARGAAERAIALNDDLALPYAALGWIAHDSLENTAALEYYSAALEREPRNLTALLWRGLHFSAVGHFQLAKNDLELAVRIDPLVGVTNAKLGYVYLMIGDTERGFEHMNSAMSYGYTEPEQMLTAFYIGKNELDTATEWATKWAEHNSNSEAWRRSMSIFVSAIKDPKQAEEYNKYVRSQNGSIDFNRDATIYLAILGHYVLALDLAQDSESVYLKSYNWRDTWIPGIRGIVSHPRFWKMAERQNFAAYWRTHGYPDPCRLVESPQPHLECEW